MRPLAIAVAAVGLGLLAGCGADHPQQAAATPTVTATPTATPPATPRPPRRRVVRLTIGVSGDLLAHQPIVARARALAGGRGYDFGPLLRQIRRWVRHNTLSFCHVETPLTPGPPA